MQENIQSKTDEELLARLKDIIDAMKKDLNKWASLHAFAPISIYNIVFDEADEVVGVLADRLIQKEIANEA